MSSEDDKVKMRARRNSLFKELNDGKYANKKHRAKVKYHRSSHKNNKYLDEELNYNDDT